MSGNTGENGIKAVSAPVQPPTHFLLPPLGFDVLGLLGFLINSQTGVPCFGQLNFTTGTLSAFMALPQKNDSKSERQVFYQGT